MVEVNNGSELSTVEAGGGAAGDAARAPPDEILVAEPSVSDVGAGLKRTCA